MVSITEASTPPDNSASTEALTTPLSCAAIRPCMLRKAEARAQGERA